MKYILIIICAALVGSAHAQVPVVTCGDESVITFSNPFTCADSCATLNALVNNENPLNAGITIDDTYSGVIPIGFTFNFYGNNFTQCVIGSNGMINFNLALANGFHPWNIGAALLGNASATNAICGPWCDMDITAGAGGTITFATSGTAPNRRFTATWCTVPMFNAANCPGDITTTQIILYETCNLIDVHVNTKNICLNWNNGRAIIGVQNAAGTNAVVPPNRNFTPPFNCTNEAWRFTPNGASYTVAAIPYHPVPNNNTVTWFDGATQVGTGATLTCATPGNTYTARVVGCGGAVSSSQIQAIPIGSSTIDTFEICLGSTDTFNLPFPKPLPPTGYWVNGNSSIATLDAANSTFTGVSVGATQYTYNYSQWCTHTYVVNVVNCCSDSCSWITSGNNIYGGNNIFGTLTNDDIRIITNNTDRAIIESGGFMGIKQLSPTTTLNVDCVPPSSIPSGLRLENLPTGPGNILVIDSDGYVFKSNSHLSKPGGDYDDLEKRIEELEKKVDYLLSLMGETSGNGLGAHTLSVTPNPNNGNMKVSYSINGDFAEAAIKMVDANGRVINTTPIDNNKGAIPMELHGASGYVIATMIVDGKLVAQQKVVLVK